jgi:hypothetical protein
MGYILTTILLWVLFALMIERDDRRSYYPVVLFSALLGTVSDLCGVVFKQWIYHGPVVGELSLWSDLGIAPMEGALFIRLYPQNQSALIQTTYLAAWSLWNAAFEWFYVELGWIGYDHWNPLRAFLFYVFFFGLIGLQEYWYNATGKVRKSSAVKPESRIK